MYVCARNAYERSRASIATTPSGLTYDVTTEQYTYVWKTLSGWKGTCKQLHMPLSDGIDHTALFQFK